MKVTSIDLFPTHVKIFDFDDDPALNQALLDVARNRPELNSSLSGVSVLELDEPWVARLRARYDQAVRAYLAETLPSRKEHELEAYVFFNYSNKTSFTPVHDHLIEADLVAIYYAHVEQVDEAEEHHDTSYYAMDDGVLVLHDPRIDTRIDKRGRDHHRIYPKKNRLVLHPACLRHSVTPNAGVERLAVTCMFTVNRRELFEGYVGYKL